MTEQHLLLLRYKADGWTDERIARATNWSRRTIKNRLIDIRAELGAVDTTHAVALAIRAGLI